MDHSTVYTSDRNDDISFGFLALPEKSEQKKECTVQLYCYRYCE